MSNSKYIVSAVIALTFLAILSLGFFPQLAEKLDTPWFRVPALIYIVGVALYGAWYMKRNPALREAVERERKRPGTSNNLLIGAIIAGVAVVWLPAASFFTNDATIIIVPFIVAYAAASMLMRLRQLPARQRFIVIIIGLAAIAASGLWYVIAGSISDDSPQQVTVSVVPPIGFFTLGFMLLGDVLVPTFRDYLRVNKPKD